MAKSQTASGDRSLLGQVPKRGRQAIELIMAERDGALPLEAFLAARWNVEEQLLAQGVSKKAAAQRVADGRAEVAREHPGWSQAAVNAALSLSYLTIDLRETAIARRFTLDDPAELGRRLSLLSRLRWLEGLIGGYAYADFDFINEAFAVRDVAVALRFAEGDPAVSGGPPEFLDLCSLAVHAACRQDFAKVKSVAGKMAKQKLRPWQEGIQGCLTGVAKREPQQVSDGLSLLLTGVVALRQKDELDEAINLPAQGLYRLAEWVSPDLVAGFDVRQPFPWDAEFHAWCEAHPDPLAGMDLNGIAPVLHEAVVLMQPPAEWTTR